MKRKDRQRASSVAAPLKRKRDWQLLAWCSALVLITFAAYGPVLQAGFIWDDDDYVYENPNLSAAGLRDIWLKPQSSPQYYPLVFTTFWLEHRLWGLQPAGYHAVNVLLHAANAVLLWRVLLRLNVPGAWLAAAVFALHPVHVESVAWITERKNTLSGIFYLSAALLFLQGALAGPDIPLRRRCWGYGAAWGCFVAAMLSKTVAATLPAALLLVLWWKNGRLTWRDMAAVAPMFLIGVPLGLWTARLERIHVGAVGAEWSYSLVDRVLIAGRALWFYAVKLAWPTELSFCYPKWQIDRGVGWQYLYVVAAALVVGGLWFWRERIGRHWLVGVLFFAGTLFPALGFFNIYPMRYSLVADHFQYLASIGLIVLATSGAAAWHDRQHSPRWSLAVAGLVLAALAGLTWTQCHAYRDAVTLWRDTLRKNPNCEMAHTNLGLILRQAGATEEADEHLRTAVALSPGDPEPHNNLAMILMDQDRLDEAEAEVNIALKLRPQYGEARTNLAIIWIRRGQLDRAEAEFREAAEIAPQNYLVRFNMARFLQDRKQFVAAEREYRAVIELQANYIPARWNLATILVEQQDYAAAVEQLEALLEIDATSIQARELLRATRAAAAGERIQATP
jgi:Flp pilus assembly protein TadD